MIKLDTQSAIEIINSRDKINVHYDGSPVWILGVNGDIAKIKFIETDTDGEVPVQDLQKVEKNQH